MSVGHQGKRARLGLIKPAVRFVRLWQSRRQGDRPEPHAAWHVMAVARGQGTHQRPPPALVTLIALMKVEGTARAALGSPPRRGIEGAADPRGCRNLGSPISGRCQTG